MTTRHVTDILLHTDGTPWEAAKVTITRAPGSYTATDAYPPDTVRLVTDETGAYDVALWCDEEGVVPTAYLASYPGSYQFAFDLPVGDGLPIPMASLRTYDAAPAVAGNLAMLLEALGFTDLSDAPSAYTGQAGMAVVVTEAEDGLEFAAVAVESVNGETGVVVLSAADVGADPAGTVATHTALTTTAHGGIIASSDARLTDARAPTAHTQAWSTITSTPTTLAGYSISDAFTQAAADARYRAIGYVPAWSEITSKPTTIAGYAITDLLAYANVANVFSAAQTITGAALGIVITGAAAAGTPSLVTTAPSQAVGATAGTPLAITASAAIAGSSTVGAAAGGDVTITAGNAARLTSGNANGGNITLTPGAGIGTGTAGQVLLPAGVAAAPGFAFASSTGSGLRFTGGAIYHYIAGSSVFGYSGSSFALSNSILIRWSSGDVTGVAPDVGIGRNAAAVVEVNNGTAGQWGALKAGTRDTSTGAVTAGLTLGHQISTGTPGSGMGVGILFNLNSSTTADQNAAQIAALWPDAAGATHATRSGAVSVSTVSIAGALTERLRIDAGVVAGSAVATTVGLMVWDVDSGALKRVSVGAADSGGSGFKLLRIAN